MKHAGFLVNSGDSSRDYLELVRTVQRIVRERAGVELEPEIRIIGEEV
jgi:UDP-N-acetylmuramate dehydrogenase